MPHLGAREANLCQYTLDVVPQRACTRTGETSPYKRWWILQLIKCSKIITRQSVHFQPISVGQVCVCLPVYCLTFQPVEVSGRLANSICGRQGRRGP